MTKRARYSRAMTTEFGAAAEGEGEAVAFEAGVGLEDAVGGGVVGIFVDGVGADAVRARWETEIDDADGKNTRIGQAQGSLDGCAMHRG